jgi:hypothetical protein
MAEATESTIPRRLTENRPSATVLQRTTAKAAVIFVRIDKFVSQWGLAKGPTPRRGCAAMPVLRRIVGYRFHWAGVDYFVVKEMESEHIDTRMVVSQSPAACELDFSEEFSQGLAILV